MTHYRVAVIQIRDDNQDLYEFLAPYDENRRVAPYIDRTKAEAIEYCRETIARCAENIAKGKGGEYDLKIIEHAEDDDNTLHAWFTEYYEEECDEEGNWLTTYNPQSKYDYFGEIDEMTMDEWLASGSNMTENELREEWRDLSKNGDGFWKAEYYTESYGDEDTYVKMHKLPAVWAVITPDGLWHEPGKVGWFAMDDATPETRKDWADHFYERFVEPYKDKNAKIIILDCHI